MSAPSIKHPTFSKPPVVEVAIGVQFETLESFHIPHYGLLWDRLGREAYTSCEEWPALVMPLSGGQDTFVLPNMPRVWFVSAEKDLIVQFQRDRFNYNWRKHTPDRVLEKDYPRYDFVKKEFYASIGKLEGCLHELGMEPINPQRLEVTYVNVVLLDEIGGVENIGEVFKDIVWQSGHQVLSAPQKISGGWQFKVKEINALIDVRVNTATLAVTGQEALRMELTVRGQAPAKSLKDCEHWFEGAHTAIVTGFVDMTTPEAHKRWGLK